MNTHSLSRRRWRLVSLACLLLGLLLAAPALGTPEEVVVDYGDNGRLDQDHSVSDLRGALALFADNPQYGSFADVVSAALDRELLGLERRGAPPARPPAEEPEERDEAPAAPAPGPSAPSAPPPGQQRETEAPVTPAAPAAAVAPVVAASAATDGLPAPPLADPDSRLPLPFLILTGLAGLLLLSGIGAAVHRRVAG